MSSDSKKNLVSKDLIYQSEEIDLFELFDVLWNKKITIILVTLIATVIGTLIFFNSPKSYEVTTDLNPAKDYVFTKYFVLNKELQKSEFNYSLSAEGIYSLFIKEFQDYEELRSTISEQEIIHDTVLNNLNDIEKRNLVNKSIKNFKIIEPNKNNNIRRFRFVWSDVKTGTEIIENSIDLIKANLKNNILADLRQFTESLELQRTIQTESILNQIQILLKTEKLNLQKTSLYLTEQALIARSLDLAKSSFSEMEFKNNEHSMLDYLRGYEALEKQNSLLLARSDEDMLMLSSEYVNLLDQLEQMDKDILPRQLNEIYSILLQDDANSWLEYDFSLADIKSLHISLRKFILISSLFGFISISLFILLANSYSNKIKNRK